MLLVVAASPKAGLPVSGCRWQFHQQWCGRKAILNFRVGKARATGGHQAAMRASRRSASATSTTHGPARSRQSPPARLRRGGDGPAP
jgi:hypothetical protein